MRSSLLATVSASVASLGALMMVGYVAISVIGRFAWNDPLPATTEIVSMWAMPVLVAFGWVVATERGEHIRVELIDSVATPNMLRVLRMIGSLLNAAFVALVGWYGYLNANEARMSGEFGVDSGYPIWPYRYTIPIACALLLLSIILKAFNKTKASR